MGNAYSLDLRERVVRAYQSTKGATYLSVGERFEVSSRTVSRWVKPYSPEDKMRLVLQTASLPDEDLGAFLRTHGLHQADLDAWKAQMLTGLDPAAQRQQRQQQRQELRDAQARTTQLEKELRRKDAALAETAALLVLKKKSNRSGGTRTTTPERSAPVRSLTAR